MNIVVLRGTLSSEPRVRELPSGSTVVSYEVTTRPDDGPADTVPVSWFEPPTSAPSLDEGADVVVTGRVRRRFFRVSQTGTGSRTEVVAEAVIPVRRRKQVAAAIERAQSALAASS